MLDPIVQAILQWAMQYPIAASILMFLGTVRLVMKPLMTILHQVVLIIPGSKDDEILESVEKSKVYTTFLYILDWLASIKPLR